MVMCFVPGCRHYSEKKTCKFFVFPAKPAEKKKWIKLIRRHDKEPSKHSLVCSCHFIDKNRKNAPTIFDLHSKKSNSEAPKKRFPKSNREVAEKWCKALHLDIYSLTKSSVICSDHFWPHHIFKSGSRTTVITGAVPILKRHGDSSCAVTRYNECTCRLVEKSDQYKKRGRPDAFNSFNEENCKGKDSSDNQCCQ